MDYKLKIYTVLLTISTLYFCFSYSQYAGASFLYGHENDTNDIIE